MMLIMVHSSFGQRAMKQSTWKTFLAAARSVNDASTEENLRKALKCAEEAHGDRSFEAGLCLLELSDYLESANRIDEAEELTNRYRDILLDLAKDLGLDSRPDL
jgi:hypothetical protein